MRVFRVFCCGVLLAGLGCLGMATIPGCGDDIPSSGTQVKVAPDDAAKREQLIKEKYKSEPPGKGPRGQLPPGTKK